MISIILGFIGTVGILAAYLAVSVFSVNFKVFHLANFIGSFLVGWSAIVAGAWPSLVLTAAFGVIGLLGLLKPSPSTP